MATYLDRILADHRAAAAADQRSIGALRDEALAMAPARPFRAALSAEADAGRLAVIAEVKRRSPSRGDLASDLVAADLARAYDGGGAACLSVLTDEVWFGGSMADLADARAAVDRPVLRKDFTVGPHDVLDARCMGADAVLLIAAALDDRELEYLHTLATKVGLAALVEVHDAAELERALAAGANLVGVNQRDLVTFDVDPDRAIALASGIPTDVVRVAESGVAGPEDARRLADAGYHAVLVGESLVRSPDPAAAVANLRVPRTGQPLA